MTVCCVIKSFSTSTPNNNNQSSIYVYGWFNVALLLNLDQQLLTPSPNLETAKRSRNYVILQRLVMFVVEIHNAIKIENMVTALSAPSSASSSSDHINNYKRPYVLTLTL